MSSETKAEAFMRLAPKRAGTVADALRVFNNLASKNYEPDATWVREHLDDWAHALDHMRKAFGLEVRNEGTPEAPQEPLTSPAATDRTIPIGEVIRRAMTEPCALCEAKAEREART